MAELEDYSLQSARFPVGSLLKFKRSEGWGTVVDREWTKYYNMTPMLGVPVKWIHRPNCILPDDKIAHIGVDYVEPWEPTQAELREWIS